MSDLSNLNTGGSRNPKIVDEKVILSRTNVMVLEALDLFYSSMTNEEEKMSTRLNNAKLILEYHLKTRKQDVDIKLNAKRLQLMELDIRSKNGEGKTKTEKPKSFLDMDFKD